MNCRCCGQTLKSYLYASVAYVYCTNRDCLLESKEWPVDVYYYFDLGDHFAFVGETSDSILENSRKKCLCGCGEITISPVAKFRPGHDSKLLARARQGIPVSAAALEWLMDRHPEWRDQYVCST